MQKLLFTLLTIGIISCTTPEQKDFPESFIVQVTNPANFDRNDVLVYVPSDKIDTAFNPEAFIVLNKGIEIASQYNNGDAGYDGILVVLDHLSPNESLELTVRYNKTGENKQTYPKRTQAELSHKVGGEWKNREYIGGEFKNVDFLKVPPEHKDHSWFIRYEGPGWESDKVGYRFYLDQRNATDVFGKKVPEPVLHQVGLDGFDSYHELQSWGMDVMKVGPSLGVGSLGMFVDTSAVRVEVTDSLTCQITENGNVFSSILTNYFGWKAGKDTVDVQSRLSIHAGSRLTHHLITINDDVENLCTGLVKDPNGKLITSSGNADAWGYIATYGKQSLNKDNLGIAVVFNPDNLIEFKEDANSHIVKLRPDQKKLEYYFLATWEGELNGLRTEEQFVSYVIQVAKELANPVRVEIK